MTLTEPIISIYKIKRNIHNMTFDTTCLEEILFYYKEVRKSIYGTIFNTNFEKFMCPLFIILNKIEKYIETADQLTNTTIKRNEFELLQNKLHALINDFTALSRENNLEVKSISEFEMYSRLSEINDTYYSPYF